MHFNLLGMIWGPGQCRGSGTLADSPFFGGEARGCCVCEKHIKNTSASTSRVATVRRPRCEAISNQGFNQTQKQHFHWVAVKEHNLSYSIKETL